MAAKKPAKKSAKKKPADAIALLKEDHKKVMGLLESLERATGPRRTKLLVQIEEELTVHTTIEEEIFYPAYREAARKKDDQTMYYEAIEEHGVVKTFLPEAGSGANNEELKAKAKVLKELVEHHADEEEKEMFPRARQVMDREELRDLGERMDARKRELMGK
ncbi:MAG TPA: hemerythrin domain-containing protein [Thermoanaerobaculia bacterium]|nr:hemerythrin domain-containing protein [Thermoanaerobaculia bacterium]